MGMNFPHALYVLIKDADGVERRYLMGDLKFDGWKTSLKEIKKYNKLPKNARKYIEFIEAFTETPVSIVSVGYERNETFIRKNPWK